MTIYSLDVLLFLFETSLLFLAMSQTSQARSHPETVLWLECFTPGICSLTPFKSLFSYHLVRGLSWPTYLKQPQLFHHPTATATAKSLQSCLTLCDPRDGSPPGSPAPGILQARALEWVAISFSNAWKRKVKVKALSCVRLLATPWTAAYQAPPSMGFSRPEYWSGVSLWPSHK